MVGRLSLKVPLKHPGAKAGGGKRPLWVPREQELVYVAPSGAVMSLAVPPGPSWGPTTPKLLVKDGYYTNPLDLIRTLRRFSRRAAVPADQTRQERTADRRRVRRRGRRAQLGRGARASCAFEVTGATEGAGMNEITRRRFIEAASLAAVAPHFAATAEAAGQQGGGQAAPRRTDPRELRAHHLPGPRSHRRGAGGHVPPLLQHWEMGPERRARHVELHHARQARCGCAPRADR